MVRSYLVSESDLSSIEYAATSTNWYFSAAASCILFAIGVLASLLVNNHLLILTVALAVAVIALGIVFGFFARRERTHVGSIMTQIRAESARAESEIQSRRPPSLGN